MTVKLDETSGGRRARSGSTTRSASGESMAEGRGDKASQKSETSDSLWQSIRAEVPFLLMLIGGICTFRFFLYDMNYIPSESMQPALEVGDRIIVNKYAYGYSRYVIPFGVLPSIGGKDGRIFGRLPERGDVVTFRHPVKGVTFIKRVIGLPGDDVQYKRGRLYLNGDPVTRRKIDNFEYDQARSNIVQVDLITETLPEGRDIQIFERVGRSGVDETERFTVPEGTLFVMGDNRDNSQDSRVPAAIGGVGFLPTEYLLGRADRVFFSTYRCKKRDGLRCAKRHFFSKIK